MSPQLSNKGRIAILKDDIPVGGIASSPDYLASVLKSDGYQVTFISTDDLCKPEMMVKANMDVLILPYGGSYPAEGKDALISYLKSGGNFICMGGYAFDNLLVKTNEGWKLAPDDLDVRINTRKGDTGDSLGLNPDQIGVFDPSYPLKRVSYIEPAPDQFVFDSEFRVDGEFEGFAASSMAGSNNPVFPKRYGRWIPLLYARDAYGRLRGSAGAVVHNYDGPYAGSSWAYFGVTNYDIFNEKSGSAITKLVDNLLGKKFISELTTDLACYYPNEKNVRIRVKGPSDCQVSVAIYLDGQKDPVFDSEMKPINEIAEFIWSPDEFKSDFYKIRGKLFADGNLIDVYETGFVVWNKNVISNGFELKYSNNYFCEGDRPVFLSGTNQTGMMFASANENPLVWKTDIEGMADYGINIMRILHFSPFVVSYTGYPRAKPEDLNIEALPLRLERQLDAIVQLCQKYKVILFLSLHDWMGVELSDSELAAQRKFAQLIASRYKNVPGIMYDVQNEPTVNLSNQPDIKREFNNFLREKYQTTDELKKAWKKSPPSQEIGNIDVTPGSEDWDDIKAFDANYFKNYILNRWVKANVDGSMAGDPGRPITVGYLPWIHPADKVIGTEHVSFSNMHFYGAFRDYAKELKIIDRRFEGKSFSLGEFGAKVHPTWKLGGSITTMENGIYWFLMVGHYALGMGASFIANWDWKDMPDCVFPWGINHPCDIVPKDILLAYRNQSVFFKMLKPVYEEPELYFLIPDNHRLGGQSKRLTEAVLNGINMLLGCHVNFGVINEYSLHKLPKTAKAIIYPVPFCPSDETYELVRDFVIKGGILYLSGDISYDESRIRTRQKRLEELCGVRFLRENYPNIVGSSSEGPCIQVELMSQSKEESPSIIVNSLGKGRVFYSLDPVEFRPGQEDIYKKFLSFAGLKRIQIEPDTPSIRAFYLPEEENQNSYILFNEFDEQKNVKLNTEHGTINIDIGPRKPGFIRLSPSGQILALESQGKVLSGAKELIDTHGFVMVASTDNQDIGQSKSLMVLPINPGYLKISSQANWMNPVADICEIKSGQVKVLERIKLELSHGYIELNINQLQALNVIMIRDQ